MTARYYDEDPKYSEMTPEEKEIRDRIIQVFDHYTRDLDSDFANIGLGIASEDFEDAADDIMVALKLSTI
ncbi:hypothetical protein UFOVP116_359 [uncultured Caudovirales phage]|uniref:Uncharacterized protein n=1 Tax=uncultured Caudovirales phage TaxID=2100421 RepID=A0A6J5LF76_9CAUD|nr:hypothetical protein UFOVP116_359 [uncultured Caudovirales phage]